MAWLVEEMLHLSLLRPSRGTRSYCDDWKWKTTSERHSAICLLSAASTPFHFHTNPTANAISNWRCHPLTFDAGVNAVSAKPAALWCLKSQESSASLPCYAERQTDPFCMFIILHLVNLASKFLSRRLCSSVLSEAAWTPCGPCFLWHLSQHTHSPALHPAEDISPFPRLFLVSSLNWQQCSLLYDFILKLCW